MKQITTIQRQRALTTLGGILACALLTAGISAGQALAGEAIEVSSASAATSMQNDDDNLQAAREAYSQVTPKASGTCVTCHTNIDMLEASLSSSDLEASTYLVSDTYVTSTHGQLGCTFCHGGNADASDASEAMEGILADPSVDAGVTVCGQCHKDVTDVYKTSLHYTTAGLSAKYLVRTSLAADSLI